MSFEPVTAFEFVITILTRPAELNDVVFPMVTKLTWDLVAISANVTNISCAGGV